MRQCFSDEFMYKSRLLFAKGEAAGAANSHDLRALARYTIQS